MAKVAGRLRHTARNGLDFPAVGDWVAAAIPSGPGQAVIQGVLPRFSKFSRKVAGGVTEEQVVAANVDTVFLVSALTQEFNPRRIERYLVMAWESGANPVIVLNKVDLSPGFEVSLASLGALIAAVPVHAVSAVTGLGLPELSAYLAPGQTVALLGSSGVGKSSLINRLCAGACQTVQGVRIDDRGRHTTTMRQLLPVPSGGLILDTPGMRELQLWEGPAGLDMTFGEVSELAARCRFHDCRHHGEPDCAVRQALQDSTLARERFESYLKLQREAAYLKRRHDQRAQAEERQRWKRIKAGLRQRGPR